MQILCNNIIEHKNNSEHHLGGILLILQQGCIHVGTDPIRYEGPSFNNLTFKYVGNLNK